MIAIKNVAKTLAKIELPFKSFFTILGCKITLENNNNPRNVALIPQAYFKIKEYGANKLPSAARPSITPAVGIGTFLIIIG